MININSQEEIKFFNIQKWNDYVYMQKTVWEKLIERKILKKEGIRIKNIKNGTIMFICKKRFG